MRNILLSAALVVGSYTQAQNILTVQENANFYMQENAVVSLGGLILVPSVNYNLSGENQLSRGTTAIHPTSQHIDRVFSFSQIPPTYSGKITFNYAEPELNTIPESNLVLKLYNGSVWNPYPAALIDIDNNMVETDVVNVIFQEATLGPSGVILPLQWLDIAAALKNNKVQVVWETANEHNVSGFVVEKKVNDQWVSISPVLPASNTNGPNKYSYDDINTSGNILYYRVLQTDYDGKKSYSSVVTVKNTSGSLQVFPNPVVDHINIQTNNNNVLIKNLKVVNVTGTVVSNVIVENKTAYALPTNQLPKGSYVLQIILSDGTVQHSKFVKQ